MFGKAIIVGVLFYLLSFTYSITPGDHDVLYDIVDEVLYLEPLIHNRSHLTIIINPVTQ